MLKISDILKKAKKTPKAKKQKKKTSASGQEQKTVKPKVLPVKKKASDDALKPKTKKPDEMPPASEGPQPVETEPESLEIQDNQKAADSYQHAIEIAKQVMAPFIKDAKKPLKQVKEVIDEFIGLLSIDDALLKLFFKEYIIEKGYIYQHSVNVTILALKLGMEMHYSHDHLEQIGLAAFLHDIGLARYDNIISQPKKLSESDFSEVRKHPVIGKDLLKKFAQDLNFEIFDAIHQEHERIDGTGYPYGLKQKEICSYAKLIGLIDAYEAMLHARPYREKLDPQSAIKELINNKHSYDYKFLKRLIDVIGVFPVTSLIKLNTREVGVVLAQNHQMPLRPVVEIIYNAQGNKMGMTKQVDLSQNFSVFIQDSFKEQTLRNDKKYA